MYNDKIFLTPQEILEHDFKIDARGYRPQEVDKYLDMIIRDYTEYNNIIKSIERENKDLRDDNAALKAEIRRLQTELEDLQSESAASAGQRSVTNIDLLRRISQLEKVVYGKNE